ncbi:MAG: primosomal replication protein N [Glaciimonas sp.]|nr:primosomal replication protein N [Glaciimonas sp.]
MSLPNNVFQLVAEIVEREVLRYTPAGIPIVSAILLNRSEPREATVQRQVEFEIAALAAGEISGQFAKATLGGKYHFTGFLARKSRNGKTLVFHITEFAAIDEN